MNEVILTGAVSELDLRYTGGGTAVLRLRVGGSAESHPFYLDLTLLGEKGERLADSLKEGDVVLARGHISQRKGEKGVFTRILVHTLRAVPGAEVQEGRQVGSLNLFLGLGFLAADPEERAEGRLVRARVAFSRPGKEGEETVFLRVEAWEEAGDPLRGLKKGDQVFVEGAVKGRSYTTRAGERRYEVYISARNLIPLAWAGRERPPAEDEGILEEFPPPEEIF